MIARRLASSGTGLLRLFPSETAHNLGLWVLKKGLFSSLPRPHFDFKGANFQVELPGIGSLPHPLGLAAGFDKNAIATHGFEQTGLSFLEIGTVTPLPQDGNPKPRMFRQPDQRGIINRMGFNNDGSLAVGERLKALQHRPLSVPLGVNIGKNKNTSAENAISDYIALANSLSDLGQYTVINISSPNTTGLRDLASPEFIRELSTHLYQKGRSLWIKLDPDMPKELFQKNIEAICEGHFDGVILSNTHKVAWPEPGGQSGHPLSVLSSRMLEWAYEVHKGSLAMIGTGGVLSGIDVFEKLRRGASAVQLYSALVYRGPWAANLILEELAWEMSARGITSLQEIIGSYYKD